MTHNNSFWKHVLGCTAYAQLVEAHSFNLSTEGDQNIRDIWKLRGPIYKAVRQWPAVIATIFIVTAVIYFLQPLWWQAMVAIGILFEIYSIAVFLRQKKNYDRYGMLLDEFEKNVAEYSRIFLHKQAERFNTREDLISFTLKQLKDMAGEIAINNLYINSLKEIGSRGQVQVSGDTNRITSLERSNQDKRADIWEALDLCVELGIFSREWVDHKSKDELFN